MYEKRRWFGGLLIAVAAILGVAFVATSLHGWYRGGVMAPGCRYGMWDYGPSSGEAISHDRVEGIAEQYIASYGNLDLEIAEIMEFDNHFYVQAQEKSTGRYAFEFLIDRFNGGAHSEPGPNMMWNRKYGHAGPSMIGLRQRPTSLDPMPITAEVASARAQEYLDRSVPGLTVDKEGDAFYGYYTFHTLRNGNVVGMLSVNGYTGEVWIHSWHGESLGFVGEGHEH